MRTNRLHIAIALLSAAIIAFQLVLVQILSIVQWYHFAYMVIAMAMLGFGAAGTFLALFQRKLVARHIYVVPALLTGTGISMALVTDISQLSFARFDAYQLFVEYSHIAKLLATYGLFFIPFFLGATAIGLVFIQYVETIGKIYFANLFGSALGGLLVLPLLWRFFPNQVPVFIAILPVLGGLLILPADKKYMQLLFSFAAIIVIVIKILNPATLRLSEYKDLSKTLLLPEAKILSEKPSPYGLVQVLSSPVLRYAPGLSLAAQHAEPVKTATFVNGNWHGAITELRVRDTAMILDQTTFALPYIMSKRNSVLILQAGTGMDVAHALIRQAKKITAVEANPTILAGLKKQYDSFKDSFEDLDLSFHQLEPRSFLSMDTAVYDLVVIPVVGVFGGSSGITALQEQFILTRESFAQIWRRLNREGAICISSWMDYPVRNPLKVLATMAEALQVLGIRDPGRHIVAVRSWGTITFVLTKNELSSTALDNVRSFCDSLMFDPAIMPHLSGEERTRYNQFQDPFFFSYIDSILANGRNNFYKTYDFNIRPATDNKPYFSQYIKWDHFFRLAQFYGNRSIAFFGVGYLLVIITFLQLVLASFLLIILPLFKIGIKGKGKAGILFYFSGIGLGYMFVEMVLIQQFILYFGNPVYASSAVITALLLFSGLGSYYSGNITSKKKWMTVAWVSIVLFLLVYAFALSLILQQTMQFSTWVKWLLALFIIAPPAFCMGIPFPYGITCVSKTNPSMVPWAWGINGCVSVISTVLATILAVEAGFTAVMLCGVAGYLMALFALIIMNRNKE